MGPIITPCRHRHRLAAFFGGIDVSIVACDSGTAQARSALENAENHHLRRATAAAPHIIEVMVKPQAGEIEVLPPEPRRQPATAPS